MADTRRQEIIHTQPAWNSLGAAGMIIGAIAFTTLEMAAPKFLTASDNGLEATIFGAVIGAAIGLAIGILCSRSSR